MEDSDVPRFLTPLKSYSPAAELNVLRAAVAAMAAGGAAPSQKIVTNVSMIGQEQSNWCWSAVTQTIKQWAGTSASQTDVATTHVTYNGRTQTCATPNETTTTGNDCAAGASCAAGCNDPHILVVVLKENKHFASYITQGSAPSFNDLVSRLNADKPVPCRVQWSTGGGHFIVVVGWTIDDTGAQLVHVLDPASVPAGQPVAERVLGFRQFVSAYTLSYSTGSINFSYEVSP